MSDTAGTFFSFAADIDSDRILGTWAWLLRKSYRLLGLSSFGDLFLEDSDGSVKMLDLVAGELKAIAICREEFEWGLTDPGQQEEWLMVDLARRATQAGICPPAGQCLAFRTPPMLNGTLAPENLVVWDLYAYHEGLAKLLQQVRDIPLGSEVVIIPNKIGG